MKKTWFMILLVFTGIISTIGAAAEENGQLDYSDILDKYYYALSESWNPIVIHEENLPEYLNDLRFTGPDDFGYQLLDFNGDGTQELVIGKCYDYSNSNTEISTIYGISDGEIRAVEMPGINSLMQYRGDGLIYIEGFLQLDSDVLYLGLYQIQSAEGQTRLALQDGIYEMDGTFYRNVTEEWGDAENDSELTEDEYYQLQGTYQEALQEVEYIPFDSYTPSSPKYSDAQKVYQFPETITLDGTVFTFPFNLYALMNDGWSMEVFSDDSWEEAGIQHETVIFNAAGICTKNGYFIGYENTKREDADEWSDSIDSFFVSSIDVGYGEESEDAQGTVVAYPLKVLNGITLGDSIDGLQDYLQSEGYKFAVSDFGAYYHINVYFDSYSYDYLSIEVDKETKTILGLSYKYGKISDSVWGW